MTAAAATVATPPTTEDISLLAHLLDVTLEDLLDTPTRPSPQAAMGAAGRAVRCTNWASYRAGRARLSSMCAIYLAWLAPPTGWALTDIWEFGRRVLLWESPDGEMTADLCLPATPGRELLDASTRSIVDEVLAAAEGVAGFEGVRVLALGAPRASLLVTPAGVAPLAETALWFEGV